mmetsp:Transcript_10885/g.19727  ORF Transcript_10885/g.19727 Transcript_10885/m.19727 type:complete len:321 (-) Transcript_10885:1461-2423(-)
MTHSRQLHKAPLLLALFMMSTSYVHAFVTPFLSRNAPQRIDSSKIRPARMIMVMAPSSPPHESSSSSSSITVVLRHRRDTIPKPPWFNTIVLGNHSTPHVMQTHDKLKRLAIRSDIPLHHFPKDVTSKESAIFLLKRMNHPRGIQKRMISITRHFINHANANHAIGCILQRFRNGNGHCRIIAKWIVLGRTLACHQHGSGALGTSTVGLHLGLLKERWNILEYNVDVTINSMSGSFSKKESRGKLGKQVVNVFVARHKGGSRDGNQCPKAVLEYLGFIRLVGILHKGFHSSHGHGKSLFLLESLNQLRVFRHKGNVASIW